MRDKMVKSSRSSSRPAPMPVEEGDMRFAAGLLRCASLCLSSADRMRRGIMPGNWRREVGAAKLLEKLAEPMLEGRKNAGKKVQVPEEQGEAVEAPRRLSDGKKAHYHRKALVG